MLFFSGRKCRPRQKNTDSAASDARWTSNECKTESEADPRPRRRFHARMPIPRGCRLAAVRRFKPTSLRAGTDTRARGAERAFVRGHGRRRNVTTRERRDLARAAMRLLSGTDGNSVQRTAPTVVSLLLATTSTGMPAPVTAARQEETTSRGDRARAATCVSRKPGSDTEGQAR